VGADGDTYKNTFRKAIMKSDITRQKSQVTKPLLQTGGFIVNEKQLALDLKMTPYDLWGTMAHVLMLYKQKIVSEEQFKLLVKALLQIQAEVDAGTFSIDPEKGAQLTLEANIVSKAGDSGYSVHTGRSRNDQIMVTEMLYMRDKVIELLELLHPVCLALASLAEEHKNTVMPGYTHMQPAKVTSFGQWALAYLNGILRASNTLQYYYQAYDSNPLGACESYGTSWPLDRAYTAELLGFSSVWEIPQDSIASRGLAQLGYLTGLRDIALVISKLAEDLLLFTTFEYRTVSLGDEVAQRMHPITGSSVMAQKKNPDVLEIIRSIAPQIIGMSSIVANILSALPMGYNRDSRETKEYIDLGFSKTADMLRTLHTVLASLQVDKERMEDLVVANYSLTTDLADYISQASGIGYRLIYKIVGQVVDEAMLGGKLLKDISADSLTQKAATLHIDLHITDAEIQAAIDPQQAIAKRKHTGGSSNATMSVALHNAGDQLSSLQSWISEQKSVINSAKQRTLVLARERMV
jgi:argininosuccinate lyase